MIFGTPVSLQPVALPIPLIFQFRRGQFLKPDFHMEAGNIPRFLKVFQKRKELIPQISVYDDDRFGGENLERLGIILSGIIKDLRIFDEQFIELFDIPSSSFLKRL